MEINSAGREDHFEEEVHQQGPAELIVHLRQMVNNSAFSDVVFICNDGERVKAQRMLLACRSEVLKSLLSNGMLETEQSEIELHGISSRPFLSVLEFLYTGTLSDYRPQSWMGSCELILASRFFILPTLETIIRTFMRQQIRDAAGVLEIAAAMLTEAVGYGLYEEKDDFLAELVIMLGSNYLHTGYFQGLSEDAFHYLLAVSKGNCEDYSTLSLREYIRFLTVILWSFHKSDIESHEKQKVFVTAAVRRALSLCDDYDKRGKGLPEDASSLFNDSALTLCQLHGASKNSVMRLLSNIDCRRIHPILLSEVVEPLNFIPAAEMLNAFRFHALQRPIDLSCKVEYVWDHDESCRPLEGGRVLQRAASKIGLAVMKWAQTGSIVFLVEEICADFVELGFFYYSSKVGAERPKFDCKRLSDQDHAMVLKFQGSWVSVKSEGSGGRVDWKLLGSAINANDRVAFRFNETNQNCSLSIGRIDHGVQWETLPRRLCYPAVSFGNSSKGRVRSCFSHSAYNQ